MDAFREVELLLNHSFQMLRYLPNHLELKEFGWLSDLELHASRYARRSIVQCLR